MMPVLWCLRQILLYQEQQAREVWCSDRLSNNYSSIKDYNQLYFTNGDVEFKLECEWIFYSEEDYAMFKITWC